MKNLQDIKNKIQSSNELIQVLRGIEKMHTENTSIFDRVDLELPQIDNIRKAYSRLLYDSEIESSKQIIFLNDLLNFYKWDVYNLRCEFEIMACNHISQKNTRTVLFVGSGAVPVSAIVASNKNLSVTAVDEDDLAITLSKKLIKSIGSKVNVVHSNLFSFQDYSEFDLIVVSGTVGQTTSEKHAIAHHILKYCSEANNLCFRNPVREEKVLMAPILKSDNLRMREYYFENSVDYISRVFIKAK